MAALELGAQLSDRMEQRQQLAPVQRHSLEILALPLADLETRLAQEFAVNPALEELPPETAQESPESERPSEVEDENDYERKLDCADEWSDDLPLPSEQSDGDRPDWLGNAPAPQPQLKARLREELKFADCPPELVPVAEEIISALNDDGLLTTTVADIAMVCDVEMPVALAALKLVQEIAPAGVAARDVAESLKIQLERRGQLTPMLERLLTEGREDLEKNRLPALCDKLGIAPAELERMLKLLRTLDPAPGREASEAAAPVQPDIEIVRTPDGEYFTVVCRETRNRIVVSPQYEKMLEEPGLPGEARTFLNDKIARARELVQALAQRESTLKRIGDVIIAEQREFLDHGPTKLRPLTMKQTAERLDLSESTVSRAVAEKYAVTPQGFYPIRYFFSGGYSAASGEELASQAVKEQIRRAIDDEDPRSPLSDDALAKLLKSVGLSVARRTVAKYRESMRIPSSSLRKKHF